MRRVSGRSVLLAASLLSLSVLRKPQSLAVPPTESPAATQTCGSARGSRPPISWKDLGPNVLKDQKRIWLFPTELARGRYWIRTGGVVLATAGLVALDLHDTLYFRRTQTFTQFNRVLSFDNTIAGMALVPISAYALGLVRHDTYAQQTAELAAEALIDTAIPSLVIRDIARRLPPGSIPPNGKFDDSWFRSHRGPFYLGPGGFPSGHTMAAFSIATIFAESYGRHRWVPWVAYGVAGLVAFSRVTLQAHFPSDVFVGAVLGFTISH